MSDNNSGGGGISFLSVIFIVFLVLKLTGVITWSWWWVTAPLWAGFGLGVLILLVCLVVLKVTK